MDGSVLGLATPYALINFVRETLCDRDRLDPAQTPLYRSFLKQMGKTNGILFRVEGPRLLSNTAIWSVDEHRILFYDATGVRFLEVKLSESPDLDSFLDARNKRKLAA